MIGKHLLLTIRSLKKNLLYAALVIIGLAIGITTFLSTIQWSAWHMTFDRHFPDHEQIFRLTFEEQNDGFYRHTARILHGSVLSRVVYSDGIAGIEKIGRLAPFRKAAFRIGEDTYYEEYAFACDESFLEIFQPEVMEGQTTDLLSAPGEVILTESTAQKFFGSEDPLGKSFEILHQFDVRPTTYTVTAVIRDFPENTHFRISVLTSFEDPMEYESTAWTYVKLTDGSYPGITEEQLQFFIRSNFEEEYAQRIFPRLQALGDIHLKSHKARELQPNVRLRTLIILMTSGLLVFLLAWFNFTLLSFSQNQLHINRLVIQWQAGGSRGVFFRQFLVDHLFVGIIAFTVGILLTLLFLPYVNALNSVSFQQNTGIFLLSVLILGLFIFLSALITSWVSTGRLYRYLQRKFLSTKIGSPPDNTGRNLFIRAVIVLEFLITFILVSNLIMISMQINYAIDSQLGSDRPQAIHLHNLHRPVIDQYSTFKEKMLESPHVAMVAASMEEPTKETMDANTFEIDGVDEGDKQLFLYVVDENFLSFYNIEVLHGQDFPESYNPLDSAEFFALNLTAAKMLTDRPEDLIGSELTLHFNYPGFIWPGPITAIVEDFHITGLDHQITPMVIFPKYTWLYCFSILPEGDPAPVLDHLSKVWEELYPDYPMEIEFSTDLINRLYEGEIVQTRIMLIFCILSLLIAGMGLFALSGLFMQRRTKAAALKKIHGSGMLRIVQPEILYYIWLALLSSFLAVPASWFLLERWMRNFHYRIDLPLWVYPACALLLILFSSLSVLYHSIRLANINPIQFIREQ